MNARRLREQNKQRNFEHIKQAAKRLFEQKGYEETTTREIAEAAEIGTGTLFLYVRDKAELLLLVYGNALEELSTNVFSTLPQDMMLLDALIHVFSSFFRFYEQHPANARHFLKELLFHSGESKGYQSFAPLNEKLVERLAQLVRHAQERGEVREDVEPRLAATSFFALYFAAVTAWLGGFLLSETVSLAGLRALFNLQIKGMLPESPLSRRKVLDS